MNESPSKCLIIIGMHRSGTSYTASILEKAGLSIGTNLMGASTGNDMGHFENEDFYNFHKRLLEEHNLHSDGWSLQTIENATDETIAEAKKIIADSQSEQWGWKDPRTTLFLNFWKNLLPNAYFLFVYRKPWEVSDSLLRRSTDQELIEHPQLTFHVWEYYNQQILSFVQQNKECSILVEIENIIYDAPTVIECINTTFGFTLTPELNNPFQSEKFNNKSNALSKLYCEDAYPNAITLYKELLDNSTILPIQGYTPSKISAKSTADWWDESVEAKIAKRLLNNTLAEERKINNELTNQLAEKEIPNEMHATQLANQSFIIESLKSEIKELNEELRWMKKTKFWKLRTFLKK